MDMTIQDSLAKINQPLSKLSETSILDAQVLIAHIIEKPRSWVLAHPEATLSDEQQQNLDRALARLHRGEPLPYVIGHWEFFGLDFYLTPDVLIPRPETELLVEQGLTWLSSHPKRRKAADIGTGCGCIAVVLAVNIPDLHILATDVSPSALRVAKSNAERHKVMDQLGFIQADLLEGIPGAFDIICANLPYIPTNKLRELDVYQREPRLALDGGMSGIEAIDKLLDQASSCLTKGGCMLMEIEASQGAEVKSLAQAYFPGSHVRVLKDLAGRDRCVEIERQSLIVHLCQRKDWLAAQEVGEYRTETLDQIGFIHCSQPEQILRVANKYYREMPDPVLVWIDPERVSIDLRWEATDGELFPHVYGPINLEAVVGVTDLSPDADGTYRKINAVDQT
jgi:release factor glutamine methyltransferase